MRARTLPLIVTGISTFVVVLLVLRWAQTRGTVIPASVMVPVLVGAFALVLLVLGWRVRQYVRGKTSMDPIAASRVAALAVSAAFVGSGMIGVGTAQVISVAGLASAPAARSDAILGITTAVLAIALLVAALVVQRWCTLPEDNDEERPPPGSTGSPAPS